MKLLSFKFKNLFSLGVGEINLEARGLTLVTGYSEDEKSSNGSGKSSLANKGILFTMFGETAGGIKADAVVNRHTKKSCFGQLRFKGFDDKEYRITRKRPAKLILACKKDKKWEDVSASTSKATQLAINSALGFDAKTFLQTSVFGQGRNVHYPSLTPKDQKAVLEGILPMAEVDKWAAYADKKAKELKPKVTEAETELFGAQSRLNTLTAVLEQCNQDGIQFEERKTARINEFKAYILSVRDQFKPELECLKKVEDATIQPDSTQETLTTHNLIAQQTQVIEEMQARKTKAQTHQEAARTSVGQWGSRVNLLKLQLREINQDSQCPVCQRDYDESTITAVHEKVKATEALLDEAIEKEIQGTAALTFYSTDIGVIETQISASNQEISSQQDRLSAQAKQLAAQAELETAKETIELKITTAAARYQGELTAAENSENPHIATYDRHFEEIKTAKENVSNLVSKASTLAEELGHLVHWKDVYGKELKLKLFEDACPFLDSRTQHHLSRLKNPQIHCDFSTVKRLASGDFKEEFDVSVWSETGGQGFESLSGGEQQMVSFAVGLSLADLASRMASSQSEFLILDEVFTELDPRNAEAVIDYLVSDVKDGRDTALLISNEETLQSLVPNRIHVVKKSGVSNVESE